MAETDLIHDTEPSQRPKAPASASHTKTVLAASTLAWICFFFNLGWTAWAAKNRKVDDSMMGVLFQGSCATVKQLSTWLHLLINTISTILLASSNYCMQVMLAPTREEVDAAHQKHISVAIGVPSLANLRKISTSRDIIWTLLVLSSLPLHLVFNSAIFSVITVTEYAMAMADESFLTDQPLWLVNTSNRFAESDRLPFYSPAVTSWDNLTSLECRREYGAELLTGRRNVLVIVDRNKPQVLFNYTESDLKSLGHGSLDSHILEGRYRAFPLGAGGAYVPKQADWMCYGLLAAAGRLEDRPGVSVIYGTKQATYAVVCDPRLLLPLDEWRIAAIPYDYTVRYCLSEPNEETCRIDFSLIILVIVCATNFVKATMMTCVFLTHRQPLLLTIGDAIASFVSKPDPSTERRCVWTKKEFIQQKWIAVPKPRPLVAVSRRYGSVPSRARWIWTMLSAITTLLILGNLLSMGLEVDVRAARVEIDQLWDRGFGTVNTISLIGKGMSEQLAWRKNTIEMVLLANTPQLILSIIYYSYNALFTAMCAGAEWARFGRGGMENRKTLRVSRPAQNQRAKYYLQLPYRFSVPLILLSVLLHWLTSQSLFLAKIDGTDSLGEKTFNFITTCGYSNIAMIFALITGSTAIVFLLATAALPLGSNIPVVGSCSAAISASCHALQTKVDVETDAIGWGVELKKQNAQTGDAGDGSSPLSFGQGESQEVWHLTLTSGETRMPQKGEVYM